jgi:uncharacterized protein (DUF302 family)
MHFEGERIDLQTTRSFDEAIAAFEARVPTADQGALERLARDRANARTVEQAVAAMVGELGFMCFAKVEQGQVTSLLGGPEHVVVYLLGNPVLAERMLAKDPAVGVYAPLRASIYEDSDGATHFTYDRPSALLSQFEDPQIRETAVLLDEKMSQLADSVVRGRSP